MCGGSTPWTSEPEGGGEGGSRREGEEGEGGVASYIGENTTRHQEITEEKKQCSYTRLGRRPMERTPLQSKGQ